MTHATILNTPASFGAEYVSGGDTYAATYQHTTPRGVASVYFSMRLANGQWNTQPIAAPERFGPVPIKDGRAWLAYVAAWLDADTHAARPDDLPEPGDRCKDCGQSITWIGPSQYDWEHVGS
jgi:hypothetical protein